MQDAGFFPACFGWDPVGQTNTHLQALVNPYLTAYQEQVMVPLNQTKTLEADLFTGVEAWDYQNPNVWVSKNMLVVPSLQGQYPAVADTSASIQANIQRNGNNLEK